MGVSKIQIRNGFMRTEEALQQPTLPTVFKEIYWRAQTSFSLTGQLFHILFCKHLWGFATLLLLVRSFPVPDLGVGSRGRTLQCPDMSRALPCLFLLSLESLKWGVTPSRNPTIGASERMDALIQKSDFLCWQTLASSFLLRSEADSFPLWDHWNPSFCQVGAHPCSGWQG